MKNTLPTLALFVLCSLLEISTLSAQEGQPPGGRGPGGQQGGRGGAKSQLFMALDANGDGVIDTAEMANAAVAIKKADKNGDGKITEEEARPAGGEHGPERGRPQEGGRPRGEASRANPNEMVTTLMQFDKNADGKLSKDEVPERMQGIFARGDMNKDGLLTSDEIKAVAEAQAAGAGAQGGPQR